MKKFNADESKDKLLAYYGDEYATKRVRSRLVVDNVKMCAIALLLNVVISFLFSLFIGLDAFYKLCLFFSALIFFPAIGALVIEYMFIVIEGSGYGLSIVGGFIFLFTSYMTQSTKLAILISILILLIICQWYSKNEFGKAVEKVRIELLRNNINVSIINNKVEFK